MINPFIAEIDKFVKEVAAILDGEKLPKVSKKTRKIKKKKRRKNMGKNDIDKKIYITTDGEKVFSVMKDGKKVTMSAEAKCSPEDTFDFKTGAELAFKRLFAEKKRDTDFKVGDRVRFRSWDDMAAEYGVNEYKNINCQFHFTEEMRFLCGTYATISKITTNNNVYLRDFSLESERDYWRYPTKWNYSTDMLEKVTEKEEQKAIKVGDTVKVVDNDYSYTTYTEWFKKNAPELVERFCYNHAPDKGIECVVKCIAPHECRGGTLYAIEGKGGVIYLISWRGVKKI